MSFIKKITAVALFLALCFVFAVPHSHAATLEVSLSNDTFLTGDKTDVTLTVYNDSQYPMEDISVSAGGSNYDFGSVAIAAGATQEITIPGFYVSESFIGKDMIFAMSWTENGKQKTESVSVFIHDANNPGETVPPTFAPEELIEFTCSCDNPAAETGSEVKLIYNVVNNSDFDMTDITVTDGAIASEPVVQGGTVPAKDSKTFTYNYTMGEENVTASPIMSYMMEGEIKSLRGNSITLECVTVSMTVNVLPQDPDEDGTEFIIKIANNGNKPISSIRVYKNEEKIVHAFDLGVGDARDISYVEDPKGKSEVFFKVTGTLATGEAYEYVSKTYTVWEYIDPETVGMEFTVEVAKALDEDGYINIDFTAKNKGTVDMTEIEVKEEKMGKVGTFTDLAGGGEETLELTLYVGDARDLTFTLIAKAPTGEPFEYIQKVSSQMVSTGGVDALVSAFGASSIDVGGVASRMLKRILTVLAILSAVFGVGLVVLAVFEHQQNLVLRKKRIE
ncbi:MAG: hypothetical protein IJO93_04275 [Clostridia bacterium]|nr:hypothetical protein [Clostridia bacterium]